MVSARSAFQFSAFQFSAFLFSTFQFSAFQFSAFLFSAFQFSAFQLFSISAFQDPPPAPPKNRPKNILIIYHFPLANFVSAGVIYPHRKKVGFGPGGLNPRKSKVLTGWTEWEYPHHDIFKRVSRWITSLKEKTHEKVNDDTRGGFVRHGCGGASHERKHRGV
jgi:hypothetical protein